MYIPYAIVGINSTLKKNNIPYEAESNVDMNGGRDE